MLIFISSKLSFLSAILGTSLGCDTFVGADSCLTKTYSKGSSFGLSTACAACAVGCAPKPKVARVLLSATGFVVG